jgi:hypothetical protein
MPMHAFTALLVLTLVLFTSGYMKFPKIHTNRGHVGSFIGKDVRVSLGMCHGDVGEQAPSKKSKKGTKVAKVNSGIKRSLSKSVEKKSRKKVRMAPPKPEFSRVLNIASVPERKSALCRLVANPKECLALADRFEIPEVVSFAANVTVSREQGGVGLYVEGSISAEIGAGSELLPTTTINTSFDSNMLINMDSSMSFEDATEYDDEVGENGDIDIGEIAAQYFVIEMFS